MPERRDTVIRLAVATALGASAFAAIRYNRDLQKSLEGIRSQIVRRVAEGINYTEISENPENLDAICIQLPGEWRISSLLADILADPKNSEWYDFQGPVRSIGGPGDSFLQQFRYADETCLSGLYIAREHIENEDAPSFFRDMVKVGRVSNWIVGKNYVPRNFRLLS